MPIESFREVFKEHPRLKHIILARIRDNFSECTDCSNQKMALRKTGDPAARGTQARTLQATAKQSPTHLFSTPAITMIERRHHLDLVMCMRHAYAVRSALPIVDTANRTVRRALSLALDKPSAWSCQVIDVWVEKSHSQNSMFDVESCHPFFVPGPSVSRRLHAEVDGGSTAKHTNGCDRAR